MSVVGVMATVRCDTCGDEWETGEEWEFWPSEQEHECHQCEDNRLCAEMDAEETE